MLEFNRRGEWGKRVSERARRRDHGEKGKGRPRASRLLAKEVNVYVIHSSARVRSGRANGDHAHLLPLSRFLSHSFPLSFQSLPVTSEIV
jgi:hypothetical protein